MSITHPCEGCRAAHAATLWLYRPSDLQHRQYICLDAYVRLEPSAQRIWDKDLSFTRPH